MLIALIAFKKLSIKKNNWIFIKFFIIQLIKHKKGKLLKDKAFIDDRLSVKAFNALLIQLLKRSMIIAFKY